MVVEEVSTSRIRRLERALNGGNHGNGEHNDIHESRKRGEVSGQG